VLPIGQLTLGLGDVTLIPPAIVKSVALVPVTLESATQRTRMRVCVVAGPVTAQS
jgi:hypothetical protein